MGALSNVPFLAGYTEQGQLNRAQEAQGLQTLSQLMQMQKQQQEMTAYPEDRAMKRQLDQAHIGQYQASAAEQQAKAQKMQELFGLAKTISALPEGHPDRAALVQRYRFMADPTQATDPAKPMIEHNFGVAGDKVQPHISLDSGVTWKPVPGSTATAKFAKQILPAGGDTDGKPQFKDGQWVYPPSKEFPGGRAVAPTGFETKETRKVRFANDIDKANAVKALQAAGYNPATGEDKISSLINQATGGVIGRGVDEVFGAVNIALPGKKANATLAAAANKIVMDMMGGKLGAGISNADRDFIVGQLGDVANINKTTEERKSAWGYAKDRMIAIGVPMQAAPMSGGGAAPSATIKPYTGKVMKIKGDMEYNLLPAEAHYSGPDGVERIK